MYDAVRVTMHDVYVRTHYEYHMWPKQQHQEVLQCTPSLAVSLGAGPESLNAAAAGINVACMR